MNGIQYIGFTFAIVARKAVYMAAERQFGLGIVLKIKEC